jgi:peptide chain release factor 1
MDKEIDLTKYRENHQTQYLVHEYERLQSEVDALADMGDGEDMQEMIAEEKKTLTDQQEGVFKQMESILEEEKKAEEFPNEIILEVRAGAGGDEAALFAHNLAYMYERYAELKGWGWKRLSDNVSSIGGYKEATFEVRGQNVYKILRWETGVHRVQRIPATEKQGRIHTSTASVAVLPMRKQVNVVLPPDELEMEFSRSGGKGGQNVNKVESAVRIIHIPTGLDVRSTAERSQAANRERALEILTAKVQLLKEEEEAKQYSAERKGQVGTGDRSEKIRTYNFPQNRVTDHRIKESWHNIEGILGGDLDEVLETVTRYAEEGKDEE